jgi:hypothetical protein
MTLYQKLTKHLQSVTFVILILNLEIKFIYLHFYFKALHCDYCHLHFAVVKTTDIDNLPLLI